ncbi:MAG: hypothetical protein ACOVP4_12815 [Bacteriovoracaceae bacterium]
MSSIYNRSSHPVEIKKISIRLWSLRDEIEAALVRRIKECEAAGIPLYVDDIKKFYNLNPSEPLTEQSNVLQLHSATSTKAAPAEDEGMAEFMAALKEQQEEEKTTEGTPAETVPTELASIEASPASPDDSTFVQAEQILTEQKELGVANIKNPILDRPFVRQAPDLDKISYGFTLLSDVNMDSILTFTKKNFLIGQSIVVDFLIPQPFMMSAEIMYCHYFGMRSRIISEHRPEYRAQCRFTYQLANERERLRSFLKSVEPQIPQAEKKKKKKESEEDSFGL